MKIPYDVYKHILSFCDISTLSKISRTNKPSYFLTKKYIKLQENKKYSNFDILQLMDKNTDQVVVYENGNIFFKVFNKENFLTFLKDIFSYYDLRHDVTEENGMYNITNLIRDGSKGNIKNNEELDDYTDFYILKNTKMEYIKDYIEGKIRF